MKKIIDIPDDIHIKLKILGVKGGVPVNRLIIEILSYYVRGMEEIDSFEQSRGLEDELQMKMKRVYEGAEFQALYGPLNSTKL